MYTKQLLISAILAAGIFSAANQAHASTDVANFNVTMTITKLCDVRTTAPTDMAFATPADLVTAINQTSTISVKCTPLTSYTVGLSAGGGSGVTARKMTGQTINTYSIGYGLYTDASHSANWNDAGGTGLPSGTGNGLLQTYTVYGQVPAANIAGASAQVYKDTVQVTVTY
ncbi:MAG TPA: spore coat U domain-containing protein [Rudaea sp.]|jgi:spore coat protein U-like protein|nr:spore coat U domain-containing protein [Rudaea sp.]